MTWRECRPDRRCVGWAKRSVPTIYSPASGMHGGHGAKRAFAHPTALQLDPCPCRGLRDILLRLLERALQRLRLRHIVDLGEMRRDRIGRPIGLRQIDALGLD